MSYMTVVQGKVIIVHHCQEPVIIVMILLWCVHDEYIEVHSIVLAI
jgi:hypothetical protein